MRAQKERLRGPPPGCGALRLDPVSLLYLSRPALVNPPERDLCLPIFRLTFFRFATFSSFTTAGAFAFMWHQYFLPAGFLVDFFFLAAEAAFIPALV